MDAASPISAQDRLDAMLREGVIGDDDYLALSKALSPPQPVPEARSEPAAPVRRRMCKNRERGLVGGLCAGIADFYGSDPVLVRVAMLAGAFILLFAGGLGLFVPLVYLMLCAITPWDRPEEAHAALEEGRPRFFLASFGLLVFVLPTLFSALVLPRIEETCKRHGVDIWSRGFQNTLFGRAIDSASEYRNWFFEVWPVGLAIMAMSLGLVALVQRNLCRHVAQRGFERWITAAGFLWLAFLAIGSAVPLMF